MFEIFGNPYEKSEISYALGRNPFEKLEISYAKNAEVIYPSVQELEKRMEKKLKGYMYGGWQNT